MDIDIKYMRLALQLARLGYGHTYTNPMVGAVIVAPDGRIIGRGWHRRFGGPHAEVNAVHSVSQADRGLLRQSVMYVTLEPCSHYGKTPPCAEMIIREGIPEVVVGAADPFPQVAGRGVRMLREAGVKVHEGVLAEECRHLNLPFMTAHERRSPYVILKWAQSADGFIAGHRHTPADVQPERVVFSSPVGQLAVHKLRTVANAIMVGTDTVLTDNPRLDARLWPGHDPRPATFDSPRLPADANIMQRECILRGKNEPLADFLHRLYNEQGLLSLMVEGGARTLQEFIDLGLFDMLRIETSPHLLYQGVPAPDFNPSKLVIEEICELGGNSLAIFRK